MLEIGAGLLIIMAKQPREGAVKTRLSTTLAPAAVLTLYTAFLHDTIALVDAACRLAGNVTPALAYAPSDAQSYFRSIVPPRFVLLPQMGADLGERLGNLPAQAGALGYGAVAMIDSDSPTLPPAYPARLFAELDQPAVDAVLGPCRDGGYYMIGMKRPQPELFTGITWSTDRVAGETLAAATRAKLNMAVLPLWYDVDTAPDIEQLLETLAKDPTVAPHSRAALIALGLLPTAAATGAVLGVAPVSF